MNSQLNKVVQGSVARGSRPVPLLWLPVALENISIWFIIYSENAVFLVWFVIFLNVILNVKIMVLL